jgi:O-antigen biosynthesis protein WbqL
MVPEAEIVVYDEDREYLVAERLFVPDLWFSGEYFYHSSLNELLDNLGERVNSPEEPIRRVYVTRESTSAFREMENREEIEEIARSFEFECVSPETRSISEQVALFRNASIIAGEYGSALHNTIFSRKNTIVLAFNCINSCQSRIAELREQRLGILLPTDGQPVTFRPDERKIFYAIDPDRVKRAFEITIEVQSSACV